MGLLIILTIIVFLYTLFSEKGLINKIKSINQYNADIKEKIKNGEFKSNFTWYKTPEKYTEDDYNNSIPSEIIWYVFVNFGLGIINAAIVLCVTIAVFLFHPNPYSNETQYSFNIYALEDNLVTEGRIYGRRGTINGELKYFFLRNNPKGQIIGHIPADKTYLDYDDSVHPNIEVHQSTYEFPDWLYNFLWIYYINTPRTDYYILTVPDGTIENVGEYNIDME